MAEWPRFTLAAGSAYTYVSRGLNPHLGFLAGWAMFLDYLRVIPIINVIYVALTLERLIPEVPYAVWAAIAAGAITVLNLRGIRFAARSNEILLAVMCVVIALFGVLAVRWLLYHSGWAGLISIEPLYNPRTFDLHAVATATSLAALTYIGFDGVTTLAEEVRDPKRTVPLATVLVCVITGVAPSAAAGLPRQRVWPDYASFPKLETAFLDVTARVGGMFLFQAMAVILVIACFGSGLAGQAGAARLLFGMGRDRVLPKAVFGRLNPRTLSPDVNIVLIGAAAFAGALVLRYELAAEVLNFGAFLAFMGVNLAAIRANAPRRWTGMIAPALGFLFCLAIWVSLPIPAKVAGGVWLAAGFVYSAIRTRGFRREPIATNFTEA